MAKPSLSGMKNISICPAFCTFVCWATVCLPLAGCGIIIMSVVGGYCLIGSRLIEIKDSLKPNAGHASFLAVGIYGAFFISSAAYLFVQSSQKTPTSRFLSNSVAASPCPDSNASRRAPDFSNVSNGSGEKQVSLNSVQKTQETTEQSPLGGDSSSRSSPSMGSPSEGRYLL